MCLSTAKPVKISQKSTKKVLLIQPTIIFKTNHCSNLSKIFFAELCWAGVNIYLLLLAHLLLLKGDFITMSSWWNKQNNKNKQTAIVH